MLERLLELFFHAKSGVFAGIFLIGTTGALVTATVSNGVATITIQQVQESASPSPSGSASPSASPTVSASASPSASPSTSPSASPSSSPASGSESASSCSEEAHAINAAVATVNVAYSQFHGDLMRLRDNRNADAKEIVENADKILKGIRQTAVREIHDTKSCNNGHDDDDDGSTSETGFLAVFISNLQRLFGGGTTTVTVNTGESSSFAAPTDGTGSATSDDPEEIADAAVEAMQLVFDEAADQLEELPEPTPRTKPSKPEAGSNKGKGKKAGSDD